MQTKVTSYYKANARAIKKLPLFNSRVAAGFPAPADDDLDQSLDLNEHLIDHPAATFFVRVTGDSMVGAGVHDGDLLIVDRSLEPRHSNVVIAVIDGELTVKRLHKKPGQVQLLAENGSYPIINISAEQELTIWGVVTNVVHKL
jgi:DNA polymerase V